MPRTVLTISLSEDERRELERWRRSGKTEQRLLPRIEIVELAAQGLSSRQIATRLQVRRPTVLKWRRRFGQQRLAGLRDAPRSGPPRRYTAATERRILAQLDEPPPAGRVPRNGPLVAQALGDVSPYQGWAGPRQHGVELHGRPYLCGS